jgi:hypothetical protein
MRAFGRSLAVAAALGLLAGAAHAAPQFTPDPDDRLHTLSSGQPGAQWNTGGLGAGGQIDYDSSTQTLTVTGVLDLLNYFNPNNVACPTDAGSNCAFNYGPDLDITLVAKLESLVVTPVFGTVVAVQANFETTGGVDLLLTDPADGNSVLLEASWQGGSFQGNPTTGLTATVLYDTATGQTVGSPPVNASGFLSVDQSTLYASLFQPTYFGITFGSLSDFDDGAGGDLDDIIAASIAAGTLVDFTAEANGQVFNLEAGQFVPEPGTAALLVVAGLFGLGRQGRLRA